MLFPVGQVIQVICGKHRRICACCALQIEFCACKHDQTYFDTDCPNRHSTY